MKRSKQKNYTKYRRQHSVRSRLKSENLKARFSVFRSNTNLYVQIIDDVKGITLAAGSLKEAKDPRQLGKSMAEKAKKAGVRDVVFDRGRYAYHGRVKALAEGAREGGLKF